MQLCRIQEQGGPEHLRVARRKLSTVRGLRARARARGLYVWYIRARRIREIIYYLSPSQTPRACARATARLVAKALDEDLDTAVRAFGGTAEDRRIWASIAWRAGAEEFHYAVLDKIAEDRADGPACNPAAAFQAFLNRRFPKEGGAR